MRPQNEVAARVGGCDGFLLGDSLDVFIRREDAERFIEEVRGDDPELASHPRIEERELEGRLNQSERSREASRSRTASG